MATTSIRIDKGLKARFDVLQAALHAQTGPKVTQTDLFGRLLARAEGAPEDIATKRWGPLTQDGINRVLSHTVDMGLELGDVDEVLYGKRPIARK